jgi:DNA-binding response OmpR family regulator
MILLVEDNPGDVLLLDTAFAAAGHDVELQVASTVRAALGALSERRFGLVVIDIRLAGTDGWEVLESLSGNALYAGTPAAVLTSSSRGDDRARARALGTENYFIKPVGADGYRQIVDALVRLHRGAA